MEPKGFMGYPKKGIAHALKINLGMNKSFPIMWTKIIQPKVFTKPS
jgi:hypothetical protein